MAIPGKSQNNIQKYCDKMEEVNIDQKDPFAELATPVSVERKNETGPLAPGDFAKHLICATPEPRLPETSTDDATCYICIDEKTTELYIPTCKHRACHACILQLIRTTDGDVVQCPMCRENLFSFVDQQNCLQQSRNATSICAIESIYIVTLVFVMGLLAATKPALSAFMFGLMSFSVRNCHDVVLNRSLTDELTFLKYDGLIDGVFPEHGSYVLYRNVFCEMITAMPWYKSAIRTIVKSHPDDRVTLNLTAHRRNAQRGLSGAIFRAEIYNLFPFDDVTGEGCVLICRSADGLTSMKALENFGKFVSWVSKDRALAINVLEQFLRVVNNPGPMKFRPVANITRIMCNLCAMTLFGEFATRSTYRIIVRESIELAGLVAKMVVRKGVKLWIGLAAIAWMLNWISLFSWTCLALLFLTV